MSDAEKVKRLKKGQWRPKKGETLRRPIDVYFEKHPGLTVDELKEINPRLRNAIRASGDEHLIAGQAPKEYQELTAAFEAAFTAPSGIRKRTFRSRRFGAELLRWLLETYPEGLPNPEKMRSGNSEERKFYNDLKYVRLLGRLEKIKGLQGADPLVLYYSLCKSEGRIITRGELPYMVDKGGKAIHRALGRLRDPDNPSLSLLEKHVPKRSDKVPAALKKLFED